MLERIKGLASGAVERVTSTVKEGAHLVVDKTTGVVNSATSAVGALNDKVSDIATRQAISQLREVLSVAIHELHQRPVSPRPVVITAKVDVMVAAIEVQVVVDPNDPPPPVPHAPDDKA